MATRPNYIDIRSQSYGPLGTASLAPSLRGLPSPRLHVAGDIPPELSPLDAFAAQSRLLAKQLDETTNGGRRISRLPPLTTASSFIKNGPGYFRSVSAEAASNDSTSPKSPGSALKTEVETPEYRPVSVYPQMSGQLPSIPPSQSSRFDVVNEEEFRGRRTFGPANEPLFFGARREKSQASIETEHALTGTRISPLNIQPRPSAESIRQHGQDGNARGGYHSRALAPPRSPFMHRTPSPRSMSDSSDDASSCVPVLSLRRKLSGGSGSSTSPISPSLVSMQRSSSTSSEMSVGGTRLPRTAFNFSRPLSRASVSGLPLDTPARQASSDSQHSFVFADESENTPVSMHGEGFPDNDTGAAPSYVYSRFSLPRGKMLQRNSSIFQENMSQAHFSWEQPVSFSSVQPVQGGTPPSPPSRPLTSSSRPENPRLSFDRLSFDPERPPSARGRPSTRQGKTPSKLDASKERSYSPSEASSTTIKAKTEHSLPPLVEFSAEEHVSKAIDFHEAGALTKSTYHLRLAARQNHPTGMLLYALACRHGWGMRPNQKEGVAWLRKAADSACLGVVDDEGTGNSTADFLERKARQAQFALSIYELGVSHMNGWGIDQDKVLALRCFEIAGYALAEAGFCYAQGIGCKKDLKKSARFYRQAESRGISMVGNSWIYKSKYDDTKTSRKSLESKSSLDKNKHTRNKSRSRMIFGRGKP